MVHRYETLFHTQYIINDGGRTNFQLLGGIRVVHKQEFLFIVGQRQGSFKVYNFLWVQNHSLRTIIIKRKGEKKVTAQNLFHRLTPRYTITPDNNSIITWHQKI